MLRQRFRWWKDPDDIRYRAIEGLLRSIPFVLAFVVVSGTAQWHSNSTFDENEWHNLLEGAPAMAVAYALLRLRKLT